MVLLEIVQSHNAWYNDQFRNIATGYTYAVEVLEANKDFIIAEVHAYIAVTYPVTHMI